MKQSVHAEVSESSVRSRTWSSVLPGLVLALAFVLAYVRFAPSTQHQVWDSLVYCAAVDNGNFGIVNMDHPLGHIFLNSAIWMAKAVGYSGHALQFFIVINAVVGGVAVFIYYLIAIQLIKATPATAVGLTLLFGGANGLWRLSGTGDIYMLVMLTTLLAWGCLIKWASVAREEVNYWWLLSGVMTGVAVATYKVSGLLLIGGCIALWQSSAKRKRELALYVGVSGFIALLGYFGATWAAFPGATTWLDHFRWASSQVTDPIWGRFLTVSFLREGVTAAIGVFIAKGWNLPAHVLRWLMLASFLLLFMLGSVAVFRRCSNARFMFGALIANCLLGAILVQWWMPWAEKIWLPLYVPLMIAFAFGVNALCRNLCAYGSVMKLMPDVLLSAMGLALVAFNIWFGAIPQSRNTLVFDKAIETWLSNTKSGDMIVTAGDLRAHLRLVYGRNNTESLMEVYAKPGVNDDRFAVLRKRIADTTAAGNDVYVALVSTNYLWTPLLEASSVSPSGLSDFYSQYQWVPAFSYINDIDGKETEVCRMVKTK